MTVLAWLAVMYVVGGVAIFLYSLSDGCTEVKVAVKHALFWPALLVLLPLFFLQDWWLLMKIEWEDRKRR